MSTTPNTLRSLQTLLPCTLRSTLAGVLLCVVTGLPLVAAAQSKAPQQPLPPTNATPDSRQDTQQKLPSNVGDKNSSSSKKNPTDPNQKTGSDDQSATKPASAGEEAASTTRLKLGPLDPSVPPTNVPHDRPVIGVALGGGAALAMSEIGTLQWLEEHHIPVDVIAGTSMGSILAALYSTGHTPEQMKHVMTEDSVNSVFRITSAYSTRSFRRREDSRELPNSITVGLRHGVSFRNSLLTDNGLDELLDKEFLRYNDQTDFNDLPIPFRCQATDLTAAQTVTFSRGSLQDAVRASASLPGVFRPFELDGHEFVDGAILENLPTQQVKQMKADVIIAVSLPLEPVGPGDLNSIFGVISRTASVGIEANERASRKLANVVVTPDISGFTSNDYLRTQELWIRGYIAAEAQKAKLLTYAVSDAEWTRYIARRVAKEKGPPASVLMVKVVAPSDSVKQYVQRQFAPLIDLPVDTDQIEKLLGEVRSDGAYDADYTVGYDSTRGNRPILLVTVSHKKTGPPFLDVGVNIQAQTGGVTRATVNAILLDQDFTGYGSELRTNIAVGFSTRLDTEYFRKLNPESGFFLAPRAGFDSDPYYIYTGNTRLAERNLQTLTVGGDLGWGDGHDQEVRAGWQLANTRWTLSTGTDALPDYIGNAQTARVQYIFDSQDRALVPSYGVRSVTRLGYLYATPNSPSAPQLYSQVQFARTFGKKNTLLLNAEGGTMFNRNVADPFRFTLGGPLRLAASAIDQYRGTDYFLFTPGVVHKIATLPAPLGQSVFLGGTYEVGQMRSPNLSNSTRQDVYFGLIAETPLGVVTIAPAFGTNGERKLVFTIGKLF